MLISISRLIIYLVLTNFPSPQEKGEQLFYLYSTYPHICETVLFISSIPLFLYPFIPIV